MHNAPWPTELCFDTDQFGAIIAWTEEALCLIRYGAKGAAGRSLAVFFGYDRPGIDQFAHVMRGHAIERDGVIRPRSAAQFLSDTASNSHQIRPIVFQSCAGRSGA